MANIDFRRILGYGWFSGLAIATAVLIIATDADIEGIRTVLSTPSIFIPAIFLSLIVALFAVPSFVMFRKQRWMLGILAAFKTGVMFWIVLQLLQTTTGALTIAEVLRMLPRVVVICGGWVLLMSLPSALLINRMVD